MCAGSIAIVPKFHKYPENIALKSRISFSEARRNHKEPNLTSKQSAALRKQCLPAHCHGVANCPNLLPFPTF